MGYYVLNGMERLIIFWVDFPHKSIIHFTIVLTGGGESVMRCAGTPYKFCTHVYAYSFR